MSGKVTLCVISAFHGSPLSLQRVIISFRVKGSICYKRTRASGIEGARVGGWEGEERRMELIGWERGRKLGEKGDEGWKWKWMRGWDREAMREEQPSRSISAVDRLFSGVRFVKWVGWRHSSLVCLSSPRLHHLAETPRPGNINGVQKKKVSSSEPGYFRLRCCFLDPYLYPVPAGILDVASAVINNQSSEFNQLVPHCFPRKSFSVCGSMQLALPAAASQLFSNAFSVLVCPMDARGFGLFFCAVYFCSLNCTASILFLGLNKNNGSRGQCGCCGWRLMDAARGVIPVTAGSHFQQTSSQLWDSSSYLPKQTLLNTETQSYFPNISSPDVPA